MTYRIEVDESLTTAVKGTDFDFESERIWQAGEERDTLVLKLIKTAKLDNQMLRVVLKVSPTTDFEIGPTKNARSQRIAFTSKAIAPAWWDAHIARYYLGDYSDAKYAEFIEATGISNMTNFGPTELRAMWPTSSESTSEAWMVLSEVDGKACFSILEDVSSWEGGSYVYRFRELVDYYPIQNEGQELGGRPVKIMNHWLGGGSSSAPGMLLLLQNGGIGPVYMGNQDYRRALYLKDDFMNGVLPNVNFKDAVANSKCHVLLSEDGGIYLKAVENLDVWFTGKYIDVPATIEGGMKIDRLIRMPYSGDISGTFAIDVLHDRLLYIQNENDLEYEGVWGNANAITEVFTESVSGITLALNDLKDIDILYCGSYVGKVESESGHPRNTADVFMLYKDNRAGSANVGQYCIYTFLFAHDYDLWINKAIPKIERAFPAAFQYTIHEDGQFFVSPNGQYEFLFFSSGTNNSELWGYIFRGTGGTDPIKLFDFGGRKITRISSTESGNGTSAMGMDLTVALETGEIYMFNVNNSHFGTGITPKWMSTKNYGKIIDIRYDGPAKNAI